MYNFNLQTMSSIFTMLQKNKLPDYVNAQTENDRQELIYHLEILSDIKAIKGVEVTEVKEQTNSDGTVTPAMLKVAFTLPRITLTGIDFNSKITASIAEVAQRAAAAQKAAEQVAKKTENQEQAKE